MVAANFCHKTLKKFKESCQATPISLFLLLTLCKSCLGTTVNIATLSIQPKDQVVARAGETLIIDCVLKGLRQADQVWMLPRDYKDDPAHKDRFTTQSTSPGVLQLIISPLTHQDAGSYLCKSKAAGLSKTVLVWIPGPDPIDTADTCSHTQFRCGTGLCIFLRFRCDRIVDCPDSSDEVGCDVSCDEEYKCDNGQCIQQDLVCDHAKNCRDGSDESWCRYNTYVSRPADAHSSVSTVLPPPADDHNHHNKHNHHSWHFNAIYSAVAGVIGLMCVVAIVIITVCRIHMRREALRHMLGSSRGSGTCRRRRHHATTGSRMTSSSSSSSSGMSASWQRSLPFCHHDATCETYRQIHPPNVAINLNLQLGGMSEMNNLMLTPPPYSEVQEQEPPRSDLPPPPYSTIDRRGTLPKYTVTAASENHLPPNGQVDENTQVPNVRILRANDNVESAAAASCSDVTAEESQGLLLLPPATTPAIATTSSDVDESTTRLLNPDEVAASHTDELLPPQPAVSTTNAAAADAADNNEEGTVCLNLGTT